MPEISPEGQKEIVEAFDAVSAAIDKLQTVIKRHGFAVKPAMRFEMQAYRHSAIEAAHDSGRGIDFVTIALLPLLKEGAVKFRDSVKNGIGFKVAKNVVNIEYRPDDKLKLDWGV